MFCGLIEAQFSLELIKKEVAILRQKQWVRTILHNLVVKGKKESSQWTVMDCLCKFFVFFFFLFFLLFAHL